MTNNVSADASTHAKILVIVSSAAFQRFVFSTRPATASSFFSSY
jgi:hypothetical protein